MSKALLMKFKTDANKDCSLRVNRVKKDVAEEDVKNLMDNIVAHNVVATSGAIKTKVSAEIITTTAEELDVE